MQFKKMLAPVAATIALMAAPMAAQAGLLIKITDGIDSTIVTDNGTGDLSPLAGAVAYFGAFKNWEIVFSLGVSATDPLEMHLTSSVTGNAGDGDLTILFTQTDLIGNGAPITFVADGGGSGASGSTASWAAYVDDSNTAFGMATTVFDSTGYGSAAGNRTLSMNGPYSATLSSSFSYANVSVRAPNMVGSSLDLNLKVPEPTSLSLAGLALLGLGLARRRRA